MNVNSVCILKCDRYEEQQVTSAVEELFRYFGGIGRFVKPGNKVLLKPNLIARKSPDTMAVTHPMVVKAVAKLALSAGGIVTIADSPGGIYKESYLDKIYEAAGLKELAKELPVQLNYDVGYQDVSVDIHGKKRKFSIINPVLENDIIINLPKLKTHVMANYTGAVKNLFGTVPGLTKAEYHYKYPEKEDFFSLITDLCCYVKPVFTIMDGISMMEGDGPSNGTPKPAHLLLGATDPFALDEVALQLIGFQRQDVLTAKIAWEKGYLSHEKISILGQPMEDCMVKDVKKPNIQSTTFEKRIPRFLNQWIRSFLHPAPQIVEERCILCGNCATICPAQVLKIKDRKMVLTDAKKCIKCYCCHEMCPKDAIYIRKLPKFLR